MQQTIKVRFHIPELTDALLKHLKAEYSFFDFEVIPAGWEEIRFEFVLDSPDDAIQLKGSSPIPQWNLAINNKIRGFCKDQHLPHFC
jgi:hypothetical protein